MAMILGTLMTGPEPKPAGTVLFVCEHGSAKSVVAAAHFNRITISLTSLAIDVNWNSLSAEALAQGHVRDPSQFQTDNSQE